MRTLLKNSQLLLLLSAVLLFALTACEKDPASPKEENPQELITTVTMTLTELDAEGQPTATVVTVSFKDLDGEGGAAPTIGTLTLKAGTNYRGTIKLLNESVNPAEDITEEIEQEKDTHQFFYTAHGGIAGRVTITITDRDSKNLPVGLEYTVAVTAGPAVSGTLNVVLSHYDARPKDGVTRSDESDIDINFPVTVTN